MQRAADLDDFRRASLGRYLAGKSWLVGCVHQHLWCVILYGRPDRDDAAQMSRAFTVELEVPRHVTLVDAQALDGIDPSAFEALQTFGRDNLEGSRQHVERLALVLPQGVSGAVVAGFYGVLGPPFPIHTAADRASALAWLGHDPGPAIDEALAEARGLPPLLGQLRALLRTQLATPELDALCAALGLSERTLQRRLSEAGTSFQKELQALRIDEARRRLVESDDAITTIALELGFASSQHFSRSFRQLTGASPSDVRNARTR